MADIFISYSHVDEEFARQIDASLLSARLTTFFAPRDIDVGESIPRRVFAEIQTAAHLAVILSAASATSRWVSDELSAAKMRQLGNADVEILPILIEDISLPASIAHVRYADFRGWRDSNAYRIALAHFLHGIGVSRKALGRDDLAWYARNSDILVRLRYDALVGAGMIEGALLLHLDQEDAHASVVKSALLETDLETLLETVLDASVQSTSPRVQALADVARTINHDSMHKARKTRDAGRHFYHQLHVIAKMIGDIQLEFELAVGAAFEF